MTEQEKSDREQLEYLKRWQEQKQRKRKKDNVFSKILRREKKNGRNRKKVVIKAWGRLGTKDGILYEEKGQLKFTDGFHDKKLTEEITGKIIPNGDGILEKTYKRMRGARNWHPLVKELRRTIDEKELGV